MITKILYSLNDNQNIKLDFEEVDINGADDIKSVLEDVSDGRLLIAEKVTPVRARLAREGEYIDTRPRVRVDGKVYTFMETKQRVEKCEEECDSMIVWDANDEQYLIDGEKFSKKYKKLQGNLYMPIRKPKKFVLLTKNICFRAAWGETMFAPKGCYLCVEYINSKDVYSKTNVAFESTYAIVKEEET